MAFRFRLGAGSVLWNQLAFQRPVAFDVRPRGAQVCFVGRREGKERTLALEALPEAGIGSKRSFYFREAVARGEDRVEIRFDRRRHADSFEPFPAVKGVHRDRAPKAGRVEESGDAPGVSTLKQADKIGRNTDLKSVEAQALDNPVQCMGDKMLAAAPGAR